MIEDRRVGVYTSTLCRWGSSRHLAGGKKGKKLDTDKYVELILEQCTSLRCVLIC